MKGRGCILDKRLEEWNYKARLKNGELKIAVAYVRHETGIAGREHTRDGLFMLS